MTILVMKPELNYYFWGAEKRFCKSLAKVVANTSNVTGALQLNHSDSILFLS